MNFSPEENLRHWNRRSSDFPRAHGSGSEKGGGGGSLCRSINAISANAGMHVIYLRTFGAAGRRFLDFVGSAYRPLFRMGELAFCKPTHPQAPFLLTMNGRFLFGRTKRKWGFDSVPHSGTSPHQSGAFVAKKRIASFLFFSAYFQFYLYNKYDIIQFVFAFGVSHGRNQGKIFCGRH